MIDLRNMDTEILERRIKNVETARKNAQSEWGKNYWDGVLSYLLRQTDLTKYFYAYFNR